MGCSGDEHDGDAHAIDWAIRSGRDGESLFWGANRFHESIRDSHGRELVSDHVRDLAQDLGVAVSRVGYITSTVFDWWMEFDDSGDGDPDDSGSVSVFGEKWHAAADGIEAMLVPPFAAQPAFHANEICCPGPFRYPIKGSVKPHTEPAHTGAGRRRKAAHVGFKFKADAIFKEDDPEDGPCRCKCCEFRQNVQKSVTIGGMGIRRTIEEPMAEDCIYWKANPNNPKEAVIVTTEGARAAKAKKAGGKKPRLPKDVKKYCYGRKGQEKPPGLGKQGYQKGKKDTAEGDCYFWMEDKPGAEVSAGLRVTARFKYEGLIVDVCGGGDLLKKTFELNFSGMVNPQTGEVEVSLDQGTTLGISDTAIGSTTKLPNPYKPGKK